MRAKRQARGERVGVLRARLVVSILVAALVPFVAAWWIASTYVSEQARATTDVRLAFTARAAAREASLALERTRARAVEIARSPAVQRAAQRRDRAALGRLLRAGEAVVLPAAAGHARVTVGRTAPGVPAVRVRVRSGGRLVAVVAVRAPTASALLRAAGDAAVPGSGDGVALVRGTRVVAGPAAVRGALLSGLDHVRAAGTTYPARSVSLPGYTPPARLVAVATDTNPGTGALRRRLALAAIVSLVAIGLYAAALARPLLRGIGRVASVAEQAMIDPLTGVANRRGFERALTVELERSIRRGHPLALVIADLDDFKQVNDRYGHGVGDDVLVRLAEQLREAVRSADTVARLGGEEFAVLLPETTLEGALAVAERARGACERSRLRLRSGAELVVTASFGAAAFPGSADRASLLHDADEALYRAKRLGKNRVAAASPAVEAA